MATSSFKSTLRRSTALSQPSSSTKPPHSGTHKAPLRRSRSVSAFSRTLDVTLDFHKRDNPLFSLDDSPVRVSNSDDLSFKSTVQKSSSAAAGGVETGRGRSVSRSSGVVGQRRCSVAGNGRSLSTVDSCRRRRSPSRGRSGNFVRTRDRESGFSSDVSSKSKNTSNSNRSVPGEKNKSVRNCSDLSEVLKSWNTWSSQHCVLDVADDPPISLAGSRLSHWDDGGSTGSISEAEEKTIIPVSEVKKNMMRSNPEVITNDIFSDIAPDLPNLSAGELLRDFRGDFARELEECEERARQLRVELAVEEHRELELSKILNEITPEPKTPQIQKPRAVRKASMERRKMSKRLEEEAIAYFDECVSISTFDDSDFSSLEDPPFNTTGPGVAYSYGSQDLKRTGLMKCTSSSKMEPQYTITPNPPVTISLEQDIRNYVKSFSKDSKRGNTDYQIASRDRKSVEECTSQTPVEKLLLDRVIFRSRIESGSMLLCGGSFGLPFA